MSKAKEKRRAICYDYLSDEIEALNRQNVELKAQLSETRLSGLATLVIRKCCVISEKIG